MSRRRMMMQTKSIDYLEGYREDNVDGRYNIIIKWLDKKTVQMYHYSSSFAGPNTVAKGFINSSISSTAAAYVLPQTAMLTLTMGKTYKLTLTVTEVVKNTATTDNDATFFLYFGRSGLSVLNNSYVSKKVSEMQVGTVFEVSHTYTNGYYIIGGAAIQVTNPAPQWDFKFEVEFEEV